MCNFRSLKNLFQSPNFCEEAMKEFFKAMLEGYASKDRPVEVRIAELPGSKMATPYVNGPWRVADPYFSTPESQWSGGTTMMWYEDVPVWTMQYFGTYQEVAIPCLKAALRGAYTKEEFIGGRGPLRYMHNDFIYTNRPESRLSHFRCFFGHEKIIKVTTEEPTGFEQVGWHQYQGGMLV